MARRRYVTTEAGKDKRLSAVSERAAMCYLLSIPHADCCGRMPGDPFEYGCTVAPGRRYTEEEIAAVIAELLGCHLYVGYEGEGISVLTFPAKAFLEHQSRALNEASRPEQPEPPEEMQGVLRVGYDLTEEARKCGVALPLPRKSAKLRGRTQKNAAPPSPSPPPPPSPSPKKKTAPRRANPAAAECPYCRWRREHNGERPPTPPSEQYSPAKHRAQCYHDSGCDTLKLNCIPLGKKELGLLARAINAHGEVRVWRWWVKFLKEPCEIGHSIAVFGSDAKLQQFAEATARA